MCTVMTLKTADGSCLLGRTMDFSMELNPSVYIVPRNYQWINARNTAIVSNPYSFLGIGQETGGLAFADGVNERGFAAAALYFPGYASYQEEGTEKGRLPLAAWELTGFLLGRCETVGQAAALMDGIALMAVPDEVTGTAAPLHWLIADQSGRSMVIEPMEDGVHIMENPVGVLTNSPDFSWHMTNLRNYAGVSPAQPSGVRWGEADLTPFGQGGGSFPLPGGFTPPARFVRTVFERTHLPVPAGQAEGVMACFHVLEGVSIPRGSVKTDQGGEDYTQYTAVLDTSLGEYFFRSYDSSRITRARLTLERAAGRTPVCLGPVKRPASWEEI